jgi:pyruvate/2-oxoglutarate dehydrogenase complex dihydrolipoamide dehydrogenase (E3) component
VLALGQNADLSVLADVPGVTFADNVVEVGPDLMAGHPGIFAGGDMVPADRTVTVAIGHGQKAAHSIDAYLRGEPDPRPARPELASAERLNTWYDYCKGCGLCAAECPCGAIEMQPEQT